MAQSWLEHIDRRITEEGSVLAVFFPPKTYPWLLLLFVAVSVVGSNWGTEGTAKADGLAAPPADVAAAEPEAAPAPEATTEPQPPVMDGAAEFPVVNSLNDEQRQFLAEYGWSDQTAGAPGIWVSVDEQMLRLVRNGDVLFEAPCGTAEKGTGSQMNSYCTPLGWHHVSKRIGADAPWGQVFRSKMPTNEIWEPGQETDEDLVLSRILVLDGLEEGLNKGGNVDSFARYIYVHGTNEEDLIGTPSSHGCIRLRNDDVIALFDMVPEETKLLITERAG